MKIPSKNSTSNLVKSFIRALPFSKRFSKQVKSLIEIHLDSGAVKHNALALANFTKLPVAPVLKSNAYGHGLIEIAQILERINSDTVGGKSIFPFFVVDSYFEALELRKNNINTPLLVIGYTFIDTILASKLHNVAFTITSLDALKELDKSITEKKIHKQNKKN